MSIRKRLKKVIVVILVAAMGFTLFINKPKSTIPQGNVKPHKIEYKDNKYIEYAEIINTKMKLVSETTVLKQTLEANYTFGYDDKDNISLSRKYNCGFGIDNSKIMVKSESDKIVVDIKSKDIKMLYCESISDVKVVDKKESISNKFKDVFKSDDEELLLNATNRLDVAARAKANNNVDREYIEYVTKKVIVSDIEKTVGNNVNIIVNIK